MTEPGEAEPRLVAAGADLRTDLPRYCVYRDGRLTEEPTDLRSLWRDDWVGFLIGCSFTFEDGLHKPVLPVRHLEPGCNVYLVYRTNDGRRRRAGRPLPLGAGRVDAADDAGAGGARTVQLPAWCSRPWRFMSAIRRLWVSATWTSRFRRLR